MSPPSNELLFRTIKIIDIAYITLLYFIIGYHSSYFLNEIFVKLYGTDFEKKTNFRLLMEVFTQIACIGIVSYIGRNLAQIIPFPLDGVNGFVHSKVKELSNGAFLTVFLITFQYSMQDKLLFIKNRVSKPQPQPQNDVHPK